jgi:hypothetical protein
MKHRHRALLVALSIALGTSSSSYALAQAQEIAIDPKAFFDRAASEGKFQDFDQVVKDMVKMEGLMTLYRYKPDDATKDQTRLRRRSPRNCWGRTCCWRRASRAARCPGSSGTTTSCA